MRCCTMRCCAESEDGRFGGERLRNPSEGRRVVVRIGCVGGLREKVVWFRGCLRCVQELEIVVVGFKQEALGLKECLWASRWSQD